MPPSSAGDRLAKALHPFLASKMPVATLKALGWYDFLSNDRPETSDALVAATEAFIYLTIEDDGTWNGNKTVLTGVIAFLHHLHHRLGKMPTATALADLKKILESPPVDPQVLRQWFRQVF